MDRVDRDKLKIYLESIMPKATIEAAADDSEAPMRMAETQEISQTRAKKAHAAVQKLARGKGISNEEQFLIEAIIVPDKRPVIDIIDGRYKVKHPLWLKYSVDAEIEANIERAIRGVGRVEVPLNDRVPYAGTGFLVGGNLLMTNRHVAEIFTSGLGDGSLTFLPGQTSEVDFLQEVDSSASQRMRVNSVRMIHPYWDMAILELKETPAGAEPLVLSLTDPKNLQSREIAVIGYPAFDPRNDPTLQNEIFRGVYNVKRLQPGFLTGQASTMDSYGKTINAMTHDASTLGGNSGSCVLDVRTGEVVALHFAGKYMVANYAVPMFELSRDSRVDALSLEFGEDASSNIEDPNPWQDFWDNTERSGNVVSDSSTGAVSSQPHKIISQEMANRISMTIPITVSVEIGSAADTSLLSQPAISVAAVDNVERMVEPAHDLNYDNRTGYDKNFLGVSVPMPQATNTDDLSILEDGSVNLDYFHFSLVMNKRRRLAQISSANVDANPQRTRPEAGRDYSRRGLNGFTSKNDRERWFTDPRIPGQHQLPDRFFTKDRTAFDKGHIVRRNDVVWGASYAEVQNANGDTFHVTNCSPQVKGFNRSNQGGLWGRLENVILKEAKTERLCVFAGPVLKSDDPVFSGVDDIGPVKIKIPRSYWKVIVAEKAGKLKSYGFLLEQDLSDVDWEFHLDREWKRRLIPIADIQDRVQNLSFDETILNVNQF